MKKIVIINNGISCGGIENASVSFANYCVARGIDVTILALYRREHFFTLDERICFIEPEFVKQRSRYVYALELMKYIQKNVRAIAPEVVMAHGEWTNGYVMLSLMGIKCRVYLQDHMNPNLKLGFPVGILNKLLYKRATGIVALTSDAAKVIVQKTGAENVVVIPNPVRIIDVDPLVKRQNRIITVGRLSSEKGQRYLIEAFSKLNALQWQLDIVGDGVDMQMLRNCAENLGVAKRVNFHGFMSDFSGIISQASIFVLPSLSECFPLSLIEAMAIPVACVSTRCMASDDNIIEDGVNGLLCDTANAQDMAQKIQLLIDNEQFREKLATKAYEIRQTLAFDRIAQRYLNFISQ